MNAARSTTPGDGCTVGDVINDYLHATQPIALRAATVAQYHWAAAVITSHWGQLDASGLTSAQITDGYAHLTPSGTNPDTIPGTTPGLGLPARPLTPRGVQGIHHTLSRAFDLVVNSGHLKTNPCIEARLPCQSPNRTPAPPRAAALTNAGVDHQSGEPS